MDVGVWNDRMLREACEDNLEPLVTPFEPACINPGTIDLRLGNTIRRVHPDIRKMSIAEMQAMIDNGCEQEDFPMWGEPVTFESTWIMPGEFVLCHSLEFVRIPLDAIALLYNKSSMGRIGLEHSHAGVGDPGFHGTWTWEWSNIAEWPIKVFAGRRYMQMKLQSMAEIPERGYAMTGRYQGQTGPTIAREAK